ncbi:MAG: PUR family DNA/RNA-binding protein [Candidatus Cloacimonetes bacterium]|nr:PUR family DNA/RNA-binding protein [Candidatus Cloacimonadota bacterium]
MKRHNEIFNEEVPAGRRTYFFDVKINKDKQKYLKITESKRTDHGYEHRRIMIFEEHFDEFFEGLDIVKEYLLRDTENKEEKKSTL